MKLQAITAILFVLWQTPASIQPKEPTAKASIEGWLSKREPQSPFPVLF